MGVAPSVSVRLTIDAAGRVATLEVRRIDPSTEYDSFFEREMRAALSEWRFAPALEAGKPVQAVLDLKIQFQLTESRPGLAGDPGKSQGLWSSLTGREPDETRWNLFIAGLPPDARLKALERLAEAAEKHLDPRKRSRTTVGHFLVITDSPLEGIAATIGRNLEAASAAVHRLLSERLPPQPAGERVVAIVSHTKGSVLAMRSELEGPHQFEGFYKAPGLLVVHLEMSSSEDFLRVLLHEAVHAYLDRHVVRPGVLIPVWLNEGLAEYLANSDIKDGKILLGGHRQRAVTYQNTTQSWRGPSASMLGAKEVKKAIRDGKAIPLGDLVTADRDRFYGERYSLFYTQSWMLVHFLMHGSPDWGKKEFPSFLLYVAEGFPADEAFRSAYGRAPSSLEESFRKYVETF